MEQIKSLRLANRVRISIQVVGVLLAVVSLTATTQKSQDRLGPTFTKDIAPILQQKCQNCHRPNALAPMSLITYDEVRPWARSIKSRTAMGPRAGVMPPWFVEKAIGIQSFDNDPSLTDEQIRTIGDWVDNGAPRGNPADMPPPVSFNDGWKIGEPDLVVLGPIVEMPATGSDWWNTTGEEIPTGLSEDRYVAAVQSREVTVSMEEGETTRQTVGGRFIIHHWGINATMPGADDLRVAGGQPEVVSIPVPVEVGRNETIFDPKAGYLMKAGSVVKFSSIHLHANGRRTKARAEIAFKFHPKGWQPKQRVRMMGFYSNTHNLDIRPMESNQKFEAFTVLPDNGRVVAFEPHMHAAGVRMCLDAIYGSSVTVETLSCVGYDHSWIRRYNFSTDAQPLLPRGTILRITGYFDNTIANRNVADPRNWSGHGHRSIDNMMHDLGDIQLLSDEEFQQALVERREKLSATNVRAILGCPLCGVAGKSLNTR